MDRTLPIHFRAGSYVFPLFFAFFGYICYKEYKMRTYLIYYLLIASFSLFGREVDPQQI